jgi:hypothetical protein
LVVGKVRKKRTKTAAQRIMAANWMWDTTPFQLPKLGPMVNPMPAAMPM